MKRLQVCCEEGEEARFCNCGYALRLLLSYNKTAGKQWAGGHRLQCVKCDTKTVSRNKIDIDINIYIYIYIY